MRAVPRVPDASPNVSKTHPLGEAAWLVGGIGAVVVLVFLLIAFFVQIAVAYIPIEAEARMLSGLLAGLEVDEQEAPELDELMGRLAAHWPENPYDFRVQIMEESEPNAMALPGGLVFVTRGLLEQAESENELAFVLAHEIGHYRDRDHLELLGRGVLFQVLLATIGIGGGPDAVRVAGASALLSDRSFSRGQEREADAFALELVQIEYGHVFGADDFFERIGEQESTAEELVANFSGTHPGMENRVEDLAALAVERGWPATGELTVLEDDFASSESHSRPELQASPQVP